MLLPMPDPLQMVIHLRVQGLPVLARDAEDGVVAAHPALHAVVQVKGRFGFLAEALDGVEVPGFLAFGGRFGGVGAGGCGGGEEAAEEGAVAEVAEGGEEGGGLDGWGFTVVGFLLGCHVTPIMMCACMMSFVYVYSCDYTCIV